MNTKSNFAVYLVRGILLMLGLYILAQGLAFTVLGNLGTDSITSPALVANIVAQNNGYEFWTLGRTLICTHITLVLLQIILLRRNYKPIQLLQVVMGLLLGNMLDLAISYTLLLPAPSYIGALGYTVLGCFLCAFGIFTFVKADMIPLSAEGLCLALSRTFKWDFSWVKVGVDCAMLALAVCASLLLLGEVQGVREGSVICACCTGLIIGQLFKHFPYWDKLLAALAKK